MANRIANELYASITESLVALMEKGIKPWKRDWKTVNDGTLPFNPYTNRVYSGINVLILWATAQLKGYSTNHWATFNQIKSAGGSVLKGERSTSIVFFRDLIVDKKRRIVDSDGNETIEEYQVKIPLMRSFKVFNLEQTKGIEIKKPELPPEPRRIAEAERFIRGCNPELRWGGNRAFYAIKGDYIQMPCKASFNTSEGYYATLLHELTHWTGSKDRVGRKFGDMFGSSEYAYEELVAELGAAFVCAELGVSSDPENHASYLKSWIQMCKDNPKAIFKAASEATTAAGYLITLSAKNRAKKRRMKKAA